VVKFYLLVKMIKNNLKKIYSIDLFNKIKLYTFKNETFLLIILKNNVSFYLFLPSFLSLSKSNKSLIIKFLVNKHKEAATFFNLFDEMLKFENKTYRKILQLKGAGYSTTISPDGSKLTLNIGLSHPVIVNVPKNKFNITLQKSGLVIESTNKVLVGDFANKIKNLKKPDPYKGKGF